MADTPTYRGEMPVRLPILEERIVVRKEAVETGRVRIAATVDAQQVRIREALAHTSVRVERVPVDRFVDDLPTVRTEGDRLIVPVVEEVLVRRIRLVEEVHVIHETHNVPFEDEVTLRRRSVTVDRVEPHGSDHPDDRRR